VVSGQPQISIKAPTGILGRIVLSFRLVRDHAGAFEIGRCFLIYVGTPNMAQSYVQRAGIAAGGIFYNVQPGTAAQLKN
jgi:hypothetical protein